MINSEIELWVEEKRDAILIQPQAATFRSTCGGDSSRGCAQLGFLRKLEDDSRYHQSTQSIQTSLPKFFLFQVFITRFWNTTTPLSTTRMSIKSRTCATPPGPLQEYIFAFVA